jgi:hypothetical protein
MGAAYADDASPVASTGFLIVVAASLVALVLVILAIPYYAGQGKRVASLYTSVAAPANQAVTAEAKAYNHDQLTSLARAKADLAKLVQTDTTFDTGIIAVAFHPSAASHAAARLVNADLARIKLFRQQEKSTTLRKLQSFDKRDQAANAVVEAQAQQTRTALGLPPTSGQLY